MNLNNLGAAVVLTIANAVSGCKYGPPQLSPEVQACTDEVRKGIGEKTVLLDTMKGPDSRTIVVSGNVGKIPTGICSNNNCTVTVQSSPAGTIYTPAETPITISCQPTSAK